MVIYKSYVCVPDRDQSSSLLCISSFFLFNIGIVHHFDTVNHLDTVETGHMWTPSTCSRPPASSFPGLRKAKFTRFETDNYVILLNIHKRLPKQRRSSQDQGEKKGSTIVHPPTPTLTLTLALTLALTI